MKFSAWYGISIGTLIILQWILFIVTGSVPEFQTTPWAIGFHMTAELFLALALLGSGIAILQVRPWGEKGCWLPLAWQSTVRSTVLVILLNSVNGHWLRCLSSCSLERRFL